MDKRYYDPFNQKPYSISELFPEPRHIESTSYSQSQISNNVPSTLSDSSSTLLSTSPMIDRSGTEVDRYTHNVIDNVQGISDISGENSSSWTSWCSSSCLLLIILITFIIGLYIGYRYIKNSSIDVLFEESTKQQPNNSKLDQEARDESLEESR